MRHTVSLVINARNLFILLAVLGLATGCTTAKTLGVPTSAVAGTPAVSSDSEPTTEATDSSTASGGSGSSEPTTEATDSSTASGGSGSGAATGNNEVVPLTLWIVNEGEHLWGISAHDKVYGDAYQWPLLFKRNRYQIEDADLIYPGQVLHIERNLNDAEIDRAIEHAKTRGAWILGITETTDLEYLSREIGQE